MRPFFLSFSALRKEHCRGKCCTKGKEFCVKRANTSRDPITTHSFCTSWKQRYLPFRQSCHPNKDASGWNVITFSFYETARARCIKITFHRMRWCIFWEWRERGWILKVDAFGNVWACDWDMHVRCAVCMLTALRERDASMARFLQRNPLKKRSTMSA